MSKILQRFSVLISILLLLCSSNGLNAQDTHYSQYFSVPLYTNPALAGSYGGTYRIYSIYRSQWQGALQAPYKSFSAGGDFRFSFDSDNSRNPDYASLGLFFNSDRVGISDFNTTSISLTAAYQKSLDRFALHYLGIGFQMGVGQRNVNYENLSFGDQFNNVDGYTLPTGEQLPPNNFGYLDVSLGLNYAVTIQKTNKLFAGFAFHHVNQPNVSFYNRSSLTNPDLIKEIKLDSRITFHAAYNINKEYGLSFSPRILYMSQGALQEFSLGSNFIFKIDPQDNKSIHFGTYGRTARNNSALDFEALVLLAAYQSGNLIVGFSYDISFSDLLDERQGFNSFELSINYIGEHDNDAYFCPEF